MQQSAGKLSWYISIPTGNTCCPCPVTPHGAASRQPVRVPQLCQLPQSSAKAAAILTFGTPAVCSLLLFLPWPPSWLPSTAPR